jgi:hypothetical protein
MKKIILGVLLLLSVKSFSQNADTSDYFRVGLYGGSFISPYNELTEKNKYVNSICLEAEYVKFKNLSFYVRGLYQFSELNHDYYSSSVIVEKPQNYRMAISFGGRYFLAEKNIKPYLQVGLNHETNFIGAYTIIYNYGNEIYYDSYKASWRYFYSLNFGVGLDVKISKKFSADIHYDLYRNFNTTYDNFGGFSVLAGLKYNIFY